MKSSLTLQFESVSRDFFGVFTVQVLVNRVPQTFTLGSEYAVRTAQKLNYKHKPEKALKMLKDFNLKGE